MFPHVPGCPLFREREGMNLLIWHTFRTYPHFFRNSSLSAGCTAWTGTGRTRAKLVLDTFHTILTSFHLFKQPFHQLCLMQQGSVNVLKLSRRLLTGWSTSLLTVWVEGMKNLPSRSKFWCYNTSSLASKLKFGWIVVKFSCRIGLGFLTIYWMKHTLIFCFAIAAVTCLKDCHFSKAGKIALLLLVLLVTKRVPGIKRMRLTVSSWTITVSVPSSRFFALWKKILVAHIPSRRSLQIWWFSRLAGHSHVSQSRMRGIPNNALATMASSNVLLCSRLEQLTKKSKRSSWKWKRQQSKLCPHCDTYLALKTFKKHKKLF